MATAPAPAAQRRQRLRARKRRRAGANLDEHSSASRLLTEFSAEDIFQNQPYQGSDEAEDESSTEHVLDSPPLSFYDDIRKRDDLKVETADGSMVMRVTVPPRMQNDGVDEIFGSNKTFRLCHLASLMPHTIGGELQQDWGSRSVAASVLAMRHFNERDGTVVPQLHSEEMEQCDVKFTMDLYNTDFSPQRASGLLINDVLRRDHALSTPLPVALLGASRSTASAPVAAFAGMQDLPQVSSGSTSSALENGGLYPMFSRTVPTDSGYAGAAASYFRDVLGSDHVGVIHVKDDYGTSYAADFVKAALALDPPMSVATASYVPGRAVTLKSAARELAARDYRHFFGIMSSVTHDEVMGEAHAAGLAGPGRFWLFGDSALLRGRRYDSRDEADLVEAMSGAAVISLGIEANGGFLSEWSKLETDPELREYFLSMQPDDLRRDQINAMTFDVPPTQWENMHYDAFMALGIAACGAGGDFFTGAELYDSLVRSEFRGASGLVRFDPATGTRDYRTMKYTITNARPREPDDDGAVAFDGVVTASYERIHDEDLGDMTEKWLVTEGVQFTYSDGTSTPPGDLPPLDEHQNFTEVGVLVTGLALASLIVLFSIYWVAWTVRRRKTHVVALSQPEFLLMLGVGTLVMGCSIIPLSLQDGRIGNQRALDIACMAFPWTVTSGFIVSFSALFSKTVRIQRLFHYSQRLLRVRVKVWDVLLPFTFLFTANLAVLVTWTIAAPLKFVFVPLPSYDKFGRAKESYGACASDNRTLSNIFIILIAILNVGCILLASIQAYRSRHVSSQYNESHYIALSMFIILEAIFIGVPVLAVVRTMPSAYFLVRSFLVAIVSGAVLLPLFVPKAKALELEKVRSRNAELKRSSVIRGSGNAPGSGRPKSVLRGGGGPSSLRTSPGANSSRTSGSLSRSSCLQCSSASDSRASWFWFSSLQGGISGAMPRGKVREEQETVRDDVETERVEDPSLANRSVTWSKDLCISMRSGLPLKKYSVQDEFHENLSCDLADKPAPQQQQLVLGDIACV